MVQVACEFSLQQETLFLAANLLDRFLSHAKVQSPCILSQTRTVFLPGVTKENVPSVQLCFAASKQSRPSSQSNRRHSQVMGSTTMCLMQCNRERLASTPPRC